MGAGTLVCAEAAAGRWQMYKRVHIRALAHVQTMGAHTVTQSDTHTRAPTTSASIAGWPRWWPRRLHASSARSASVARAPALGGRHAPGAWWGDGRTRGAPSCNVVCTPASPVPVPGGVRAGSGPHGSKLLRAKGAGWGPGFGSEEVLQSGCVCGNGGRAGRGGGACGWEWGAVWVVCGGAAVCCCGRGGARVCAGCRRWGGWVCGCDGTEAFGRGMGPGCVVACGVGGCCATEAGC